MEKWRGFGVLYAALVAVVLIWASPARAFDITGTVTYGGGTASRVYITGETSNGAVGTSIASIGAAGSAPFTIRGVSATVNNLRAFIDKAGTGTRHASDPSYFSQIPIDGASSTGVTISLVNPAPVTPLAPFNVKASPGSGGAVVEWESPRNVDGIEIAESYNIYWSTNPTFTPTDPAGVSSFKGYPATGEYHYLLTGLNDGEQLYFAVTAKVGGQESSPSQIIGPVTIGAPAGGNTVSGTVTVPGAPAGSKLYVVVLNESGSVFATAIADPSSSQAYSVPGVADGFYGVYVILDVNGDGVIGLGDIVVGDAQAPQISVSGSPVANVDVTLVPQPAQAAVSTSHWKNAGSEGYGLNFDIRSAAKLPVKVTLLGGPGIVGPIDMGIKDSKMGEFQAWLGVQSRPSVNPADTYSFDVEYSDGSTGTLTAAVTGVLDSFATPRAPLGDIPTTSQPTFTWDAPANPPAGFYGYSLWLSGNGLWWNPDMIPGSQLSAPFNFDGRASSPGLSVGTTYNWSLSVEDGNGNRAESQGASFTFGTSGSIQGRVTSSGAGAGLSGVNVQAFDAGNGMYAGSTMTDGSGYYTLRLPTGAYKVQFSGYGQMLWYDLRTDQASALPVSVTAPNAVPNINAVLAVGGNIFASPTSLSFDNVSAGSSSAPQTVTFTNNGPGNLTVSFSEMTGDVSQFSVQPGVTNPCPQPPHTFAPNESCTLNVIFSAAATGPKSATMVVHSDAANFPMLNIYLNGSSPAVISSVSFSAVVNDTVNPAVQGAAVEMVGNPAIATSTAADGSFSLNGLPLGTPFSVKISKNGYVPSYTANFNATSNITSPSPFTLFGPVDLTNWGVTAGKGVIRGRVADNANPSTGYLSGAVVTATSALHPNTPYPVTYFDGTNFGGSATFGNGTYLVLNVDEGDTVNVTAIKAGWTFNSRTFLTHADAVSQGRIYGFVAMAQTATVKLFTNGALPAGARIGGLTLNLPLPAGVTVNPPEGGPSPDVFASGAATGSMVATNYQPASHNLAISLVNANGFGIGEFATVTVSYTTPNPPNPADFLINPVSIVDGNSVALPGIGMYVSTGSPVQTGAIAGRVSNSSGGGMLGVNVQAYEAATGMFVSSTMTDSSGYYNLGGLQSGSYKVQFNMIWYSNAFDQASAQPVAVSAPNITMNIDAVFASVQTGAISGRVTNSAGSGMAGVGVQAYDVATGMFVSSTMTDATGYYNLGGLQSGSYKVQFYNMGQMLWYSNAFDQASALPVPVTASNTTMNIDAVIAPVQTGAISGKVTNSAGVGVSGVRVFVYDAAGTHMLGTEIMTQFDGSYTTGGFVAGSYKVFFDGGSQGYFSQWYNNKPSAELADLVTVSSTAATSGIDALLSRTGSITGMVNYSGGTNHHVYITADSPNGPVGTSLDFIGPAGSTAFTIRGVPAGTSNLRAFIDMTETGVRHASDPAGYTMATTDSGNADIYLSDPAPVTPVPPFNVKVTPFSGSALVEWKSPRTSDGAEIATSYNIYWSTDPNVSPTNTTGGGSRRGYPANDENHFVLTGLADGSPLYCVVTAQAGVLESAPSQVFGPVTIGTPPGGVTVSGTITFTGSYPEGKLYVVASDEAGKLFATGIANPVSPQAYTIPGVTAGQYRLYVILDLNGDGQFGQGSGDIIVGDKQAPLLAVSAAALTGVDVTLVQQPAQAWVATSHWKNGTYEGYSLDFDVRAATKLPVRVTLRGGPGISGPVDMGLKDRDGGGFSAWLGVPNRPSVNPPDIYNFDVVYADGTSGTLSAAVTGVLDSFATPQVPQGNIPATASPTFTWSAPANPPAGVYGYEIWMSGNNLWWDTDMIPASQLSALFNFDGRASSTNLTAGTYNWSIAVEDIYGNRAESQGASFTVGAAGGGGAVSASPMSFNFGDVLVGSSSAPQILTFTNNGPGSLSVSSSDMTGDSSQFSVQPAGVNPCPELPHTFASVESCTLSVVFTPTSAGPKGATLVTTSNAANMPVLNITLNGNGSMPTTPATGVTLTASPTGAQTVGSPVLFTAQGQGSTGYEYRFWVYSDATGWTMVHDYSATATWQMPGSYPVGNYVIQVDVRSAGSSVDRDAVTMIVNYHITTPAAPPATGVSLTASPAGSQTVGNPVLFTAAGEGSTGYEYRFWVYSDATGWTMVCDYGATATWQMPGSYPVGSYVIQVDVRSTGSTVDRDAVKMIVNYQIKALAAPPATGVTLTASPAGSQTVGSPVLFTAAGEGSTGYEYRFWVYSNATGWTLVRDYSTTATWQMPGTYSVGSYVIQVDVRSAGSTVDRDAVKMIVNYQITAPAAPPATGVTLTASPTGSQTVGSPVLFTAQGQGSTGYEYRFWVYSDATGWTLVRDYSATATWQMPGSYPVGSYVIQVDVRSTASSVDRDAVTMIVNYHITTPAAPPATGVTLTASPAGSQTVGSPVLFTAQGQGSTGYEYRFWVYSDTMGWTLVRNYSATATWQMPSSYPVGNYVIQVDVRSTDSSVDRDAVTRIVNYRITAPVAPPATGVTLTASPAGSQTVGSPVVFTAVGEGSTGYEYRFWAYSDTTGWTLVRDYSATATWQMPGSYPVGSYVIQVDVRSTGSSVDRDAVTRIVNYRITSPVAPPATGVTLAASPDNSQTVGSPVLFTAAGEGSTGYEYRFWVYSDSTGWTMVRDYSATATWQMPGSYPVGSYVIQVDVRSAGSSLDRDAVTRIVNYRITSPIAPPATGVTLTASPENTQTVGSTVLFTAAGEGSTGYEYRFWVYSDATGWMLARDYNATATWQMPGSYPAGNYVIQVDVRSAGSSLDRDALARIANYQLVP